MTGVQWTITVLPASEVRANGALMIPVLWIQESATPWEATPDVMAPIPCYTMPAGIQRPILVVMASAMMANGAYVGRIRRI